MRTLVKKYLTALQERRGSKATPSLVGFWGANKTLHTGALSQWYMHHVDRIEVSPFTIPVLEKHWNSDYEVRYMVPSAEHAMMLSKAIVFSNVDILQEIAHSPSSPAHAKALGRKVKGFDFVVWDEVKYQIVRDINYNKFSRGHCLDIAQHFVKMNRADRNGILFVETSPYDAIWGIKSGDVLPINRWKGDNLLGFALTEVIDLISEGEKPW